MRNLDKVAEKLDELKQWSGGKMRKAVPASKMQKPAEPSLKQYKGK